MKDLVHLVCLVQPYKRDKPDTKYRSFSSGGLYQEPVRVGGARTYRGQHRYGGDLGGTLGFPVELGLHTIPTLDPLMNHIPSGR